MTAALSFAGLEWARPAAFALLALPIVLLVLSRASARPREVATGALELWNEVARSDDAARERRGGRVPPGAWWLAAALALAALALAQPDRPPRTAEFLVVVDRSPSMYLVDGSATRLARAWSAAREWMLRERVGGDVEWLDGVERARGAEIPPRWLDPPPRERDEPRFDDFDRARTLWITDRAPKALPARAGFSASGGSAVPGPIGTSGSTRLVWDGERIVEVAGGAHPRSVRIEGDAPPPLASIVDAWAGARSIARASQPGVADLVIDARPSGPASDVVAARDGWSVRGRASEAVLACDDGPCETWLSDGRRALVTWRRGTVLAPWVAMEEPEGDPAAFAVSWAALFDDALAEPLGFASLSERRDAGPSAFRAPLADGAEGTERASAISAALALLALVAALVAFATTMQRGIRQ